MNGGLCKHVVVADWLIATGPLFPDVRYLEGLQTAKLFIYLFCNTFIVTFTSFSARFFGCARPICICVTAESLTCRLFDLETIKIRPQSYLVLIQF
jgi:hypothetical protein